MRSPADAAWGNYEKSFAVNLRSLRQARNLSQRELACLAGMSRNQVGNLEACSDPQLSTVYKLAHALKVPPAALLPGAVRLLHHAEMALPEHLLPFGREYVAARTKGPEHP